MLVRILSYVQKMGWQTTLNTWVRVLLVHLFTIRRFVPQVFLKEFGAFVDAVHGCSTALRVGSTPIATARSHVVWPRSQQSCDLTRVSGRRGERTASAKTVATMELTSILFVVLGWETARCRVLRDSGE